MEQKRTTPTLSMRNYKLWCYQILTICSYLFYSMRQQLEYIRTNSSQIRISPFLITTTMLITIFVIRQNRQLTLSKKPVKSKLQKRALELLGYTNMKCPPLGFITPFIQVDKTFIQNLQIILEYWLIDFSWTSLMLCLLLTTFSFKCKMIRLQLRLQK